jgi:hypothetical protein
MRVQNLVQVGIQPGREGAGAGGLAGADFPGEQAGDAMIGQERKAGLEAIT